MISDNQIIKYFFDRCSGSLTVSVNKESCMLVSIGNCNTAKPSQFKYDSITQLIFLLKRKKLHCTSKQQGMPFKGRNTDTSRSVGIKHWLIGNLI